MTDFLEIFAESNEAALEDLQDVRLGAAPAFLIPFTTDTEEVRLHYVEDPEVHRYVICPGTGRCPLCHVGDAVQVFVLLPVYSVDLGAVAVLRISRSIGPGALARVYRVEG